jgi:hypothetical protein
LGYSLLSHNWICPLSKWIKAQKAYKENPQVLEIMAGNGSLSFSLAQEGVNIRATDLKTWEWEWEEWTEVEKLSALDAITKYVEKSSFLLCSWAFMNSDLYASLELTRKLNPECRLIYIGESAGGCTACHKFFNAVEKVEDHKFTKAVKQYRSMCGLYDSVQLGK